MNLILHQVNSFICAPKNSIAIMVLDNSTLGLENKFLENKSGRIFCVRQVSWVNYNKFIYRSSGSSLAGELLMQLESKVSGVFSGTQSKKSKTNWKSKSTPKRGISYPDIEEKKKTRWQIYEKQKAFTFYFAEMKMH